MEVLINATRIYYTDLGKTATTPVVLIHGFPFSHEMWNPQIEVLNSNFRVVAYDVRGHGKSEVGDGQYTIELFVDDLIALLDHLQIRKVVLCGLSMGGYIALRAIERNPERVLALVLCDTMAEADSNETKVRRATTIRNVKKDGVRAFAEGFLKSVFAPQSFISKPDDVELIKRTIESNSPLGICGTLLAMAGRTDTTSALAKISVQTLILVGERDTLIPPSKSQAMHDKIPNSKLHIISNAAHLSNLENPEEFNRHLLDFLNDIR